VRGLEDRAREVLDRRLLRDSDRPVCVAFSGGGDSLALTLIADAWARDVGRPLVILSVDHRLQPASAEWLRFCRDVAGRLGRPFRGLTWEGDKPSSGLPAAARAARHGLLAHATRQTGAHVILLGHTADDVREAAAMRDSGSTTPSPREWSPSPAWPEGRRQFLLRPLIGARRDEIRSWLAGRREAWIDDPANHDLRYARVRARAVCADASNTVTAPPPGTLAAIATERAGVIRIDRDAFRAASSEDAARLLGIAAVCAGGGDRRPAGARVGRLSAAVRGLDAVTATLAGARIEARGEQAFLFREAGEAQRGGLGDMPMGCGEKTIWDGRFEVSAKRSGVTVRRLAGRMQRLPQAQRTALRDLPAAARGALPALCDDEGRVDCAILTGDAVSLVGERLRAALGAVVREPE
jgi:tRNA(Ile)-lysidine synthase